MIDYPEYLYLEPYVEEESREWLAEAKEEAELGWLDAVHSQEKEMIQWL